ncbi:hypothetical protein Tco_1243635 [Tanacetum coccineum]
MTEHPDILRRVHDDYHRFKNDDLVKNIFNSRKNKDGAGMKIPDWMLTEEMKLTDHYKMIPNALRSPNHVTIKGESSAPRKSTVIRFRVPRRQDPETPIPTAAEIDVTNLDETIQISIVPKNLNCGNEIDNVMIDEFMNDIFNIQEDPGTRIELGSYKESPEVEIDVDLVIVNANDEEEESAGDEFELKRREKGKGIQETRDTPPTTPIRSPRTHIAHLSSDKETL